MQAEVKSAAKKRLGDLLKTAVGGLVVAAASLTTPAADAPAAPPDQAALEQRVQEVRKQSAVSNAPNNATEETLAAFHNWGNHWHNWGNWPNWHNWHNW
jgi:hypothetical protein